MELTMGDTMSDKIYYLNSQTWGSGEVLLNGFPIDKLNGKDARASMSILNPYLCGKENVLEFKIKGKVKGTVEWHSKGDTVITGAKPEHPVKVKRDGKAIENFEVTDGSLTFASPGINFSDLFKGDPLKVPDKELLDFGEKLAKAFNSEDLETIAEVFKPKVAGYNKALPYKLSFDSFIEMMKGMCKKFKIARKDMEIVRLCNDRIYEIRRKNGEPFIYIEEDGGISRLPVYVSKVDGKLCVVR